MTYELDDGAIELVPDEFLQLYMECTNMGPDKCRGPFHVLNRATGMIIGFETEAEAKEAASGGSH